MCLIVFAYNCHPRYRLILGANRDEFRHRPTEPVRFWSDAPQLLAGRDSVAGGTWLGITTTGRLAALTNYRDPHRLMTDPPSRGRLVSAYLQNPQENPEEFQSELVRTGGMYRGLNLLYGSASELFYYTNRGGSSGPVSPGIHGLSNHLLDTGWPKVTAASSRLKDIVQQAQVDPEQIFSALSDAVPFAYDLLPDTGVGPEQERMLSPLFIENELYGTRSTTVLLIDHRNRVTFSERSFDPSAGFSTPRQFNFTIVPGTP